MHPLGTYLRLALIIAIVSVLTSALLLLFGLTPLGPMDPPEEDFMEHVGYVATLSAAVSGIFALMVGAVAIIAVIIAERAETRAIEQLKVDISRLWMTLHSLRNRGILYTSPEAVNGDIDLFAEEREALHSVLNSPTGFSLYAWQAKHSERGFKTLTADLAGLINLLTLKQDGGQALFNTISIRANKTADLVAALTDHDMAEMAAVVKKLGTGLDQARSVAQSDFIADFLREWVRSSNADLHPPSQKNIDDAAAVALRTIGGEADKTVRHFGEKAMTGDENDVATWHKLISKLDLDEKREK